MLLLVLKVMPVPPGVSDRRSAGVCWVTGRYSRPRDGFEQVFARGVEAWSQPGDVLLVFSTSGNSRNLIRAAEAARARCMKVLGLLGRDGGQLRQLCELSLIVPGVTSDRIQEIDIKAAPLLIAGIEHALFAHHKRRMAERVGFVPSGDERSESPYA